MSGMSLRTRKLVFVTFFGSCLAVGLLLVSLTTNHWLRASAKRPNSTESTGDIYYGLFSGTKYLNFGFGLRNYTVDVYSFARTEPNIMNYWLWFFTALGAGFALFSSAIAAIAAVLKAASQGKNHGVMLLLIVSNISSAISQILAFVCWIVQFYIHLRHNVLSAEDHKHHWYSTGLAYFGFSFWLVIASTVIVFINIIILLIARKHERWNLRGRIETPIDEKNQTAIMLY